MPKKSYAEQIAAAQLMQAALQAHAEQVGRRGIDESFITRLGKGANTAIGLNTEQEKLKADQKKKTEELEAELKGVGELMSEARKIVKLEFPQSAWKEFGINDKK